MLTRGVINFLTEVRNTASFMCGEEMVIRFLSPIGLEMLHVGQCLLLAVVVKKFSMKMLLLGVICV